MGWVLLWRKSQINVGREAMKDAGNPVCYVAPGDGGEHSCMQNPKFNIMIYLSKANIVIFFISCIDLNGMKRSTSSVRFRQGIFIKLVLFLFTLVIFFLLRNLSRLNKH